MAVKKVNFLTNLLMNLKRNFNSLPPPPHLHIRQALTLMALDLVVWNLKVHGIFWFIETCVTWTIVKILGEINRNQDDKFKFVRTRVKW